MIIRRGGFRWWYLIFGHDYFLRGTYHHATGRHVLDFHHIKASVYWGKLFNIVKRRVTNARSK